MSRRLIALCVILLVTLLVAYVFYWNPNEATVNFGGNSATTVPMALVLIVSFCLGSVLVAAIATVFGLAKMFQDFLAERRHRRARAAEQSVMEAREYLAAGNFAQAKSLARKIIAQHPQQITARLLLAEAALKSGDAALGVKTLDEARAEDRENIELLFRSAELNRELQNFTAEYDHLQLILKQQPTNISALEQLVPCSLRLGRTTEAIDYQRRVIRFQSGGNSTAHQLRLADLELRQALSENRLDIQKLKAGVEDVLRRHRDFAPALAELARAERMLDHCEKASALYVRAYLQTEDPRHLEAACQLWLEKENPSRAIETAKEAARELQRKHPTPNVGSILAQAYLINMMLQLELVDFAEREFNRLREQARSLSFTPSLIQLLEAKLLRRRGESDRAAQLAIRTLEDEIMLPGGGERSDAPLNPRKPVPTERLPYDPTVYAGS